MAPGIAKQKECVQMSTVRDGQNGSRNDNHQEDDRYSGWRKERRITERCRRNVNERAEKGVRDAECVRVCFPRPLGVPSV